MHAQYEEELKKAKEENNIKSRMIINRKKIRLFA